LIAGAQDEEKEDPRFVRKDGNLYLKHEVTSVETLKGVALRYGIKVAELKKVNNIWEDSTFYSKKVYFCFL